MTEVRLKPDRLAPDSVPLTTEVKCQGKSEEGVVPTLGTFWRRWELTQMDVGKGNIQAERTK